MRVRELATRLCWFGAGVLALVAYGLLLVWIVARAGYDVSAALDGLLLISAAAIVLMVLLILLAFCIEHGPHPDSKAGGLRLVRPRGTQLERHDR